MEQLAPVAAIEYIVLFIICLGCFLIGYFFARSYFSKRYSRQLRDCLSEKEVLRESVNKHANSTFNTIKARKTRDRRGALHTSQDNPLDFDRIGKADHSVKDDLKKISGIGPFIEERLNSIGIFTFEQISNFTEQDMDQVTELIQFFPGRIKRDDWKGQAARLKGKN
ncbi:hypothetical protein [Sinomicrobium weinanense]|uniref:Uncharacterized protein n=1 Tax=Sinomicrobium weinanense TaxID=2842200 RepID=A0A926JUM1_9FLAO|nr:hypothetical protein [Sinomicrobium weinanense]MBC9797656.1 hypothetical protein [Sinomicrobium weinanense]MBU3122662.1 hypothetical protein [Sinomicrobium weinanense]